MMKNGNKEIEWQLHFKAWDKASNLYQYGFITHDTYFKALEKDCLPDVLENYRKWMFKCIEDPKTIEKALEQK